MSIVGGDPLELLLYSQGQISTPLSAGAAEGSDQLDTQQRASVIGEPVPIVFCRRVGDVGGVLVSPGASEARFTNNGFNEVTAYYRLVVSEGELDGVQVRDVFQRSCRVGTFSQAFERRAGDWEPGNFITDLPSFDKPEAPYYCGTGGSYENLTTFSFQITAPVDDTRWDRQVHLFIRGGMHVTRLLDSVTGPSNNVADLILWLLQRSSRIPAALIDTAAMEAAAAFSDAMGFWFNGEVKESTSLADFIAGTARYFLLGQSKRNGRIGLRPLLPVNGSDLLDVDPITPATLFDESRIIPGSFEISYVPLAERRPFCALMLWRQQPDDDLGLIRTTEVRYAGSAIDGPYEQHDLSVFCASELHAVRVGAYTLARRRYITHTIRIRARPSTTNQALAVGDVVQVQLARTASSAAAGEHNYLYQIERISKARSGELAFELVHFPVDDTGRSLVALDVMAATAGGVILPTGKAEAVTCDVNADDDETVPDEDSLDPVDIETDYGLGSLEAGGGDFSGGDFTGAEEPGGGGWGGGGGGGGGGASPGDGTAEGEDSLDNQVPIPLTTVPQVGVGSYVPQEWIDRTNDEIAALPPGSEWSINAGNEVYLLRLGFTGANIVISGLADITIAASSGFYAGRYGPITVRNGYGDGSNGFDAGYQDSAGAIRFGGLYTDSVLNGYCGLGVSSPCVVPGADVYPQIEIFSMLRTA